MKVYKVEFDLTVDKEFEDKSQDVEIEDKIADALGEIGSVDNLFITNSN